MQVEDITPASGPHRPLGTTGTNERGYPKGRPSVRAMCRRAACSTAFRPGRCIGRIGRRNQTENAVGSDLWAKSSCAATLFFPSWLPHGSAGFSRPGTGGSPPLDILAEGEDNSDW